MKNSYIAIIVLTLTQLPILATAIAEDIEDAIEHPMIERYPGQQIKWQKIENYMPYNLPVGPVTGYRKIDDWIKTEGRVTRTFYALESKERSFSEVYINYLDALKSQDFEIIGQRMSQDRRGTKIGSQNWIGVAYAANPIGESGEVNTIFAGTSSSGGAGAIVAKKERAAGTAYVVVTVEQHSANYVGTLVDIIEVEAAESGLVVVNAEAMGSDIAEYGRVVLDGIVFEFNSASLAPSSNEALTQIALYLKANPEKLFYVVGHTDSVGTYDYNANLSQDRADSVVRALVDNFSISGKRIQAHGVGPLAPVFSNTSDGGREANRRVELVERPPTK